jgi:hypothetical protein
VKRGRVSLISKIKTFRIMSKAFFKANSKMLRKSKRNRLNLPLISRE